MHNSSTEHILDCWFKYKVVINQVITIWKLFSSLCEVGRSQSSYQAGVRIKRIKVIFRSNWQRGWISLSLVEVWLPGQSWGMLERAVWKLAYVMPRMWPVLWINYFSVQVLVTHFFTFTSIKKKVDCYNLHSQMLTCLPNLYLKHQSKRMLYWWPLSHSKPLSVTPLPPY